MPAEFTGEGGKIGIRANLFEKVTQPCQQFHFNPCCVVAAHGFGVCRHKPFTRLLIRILII
ncbi:hypothetical protein NUKP32_28690 [Klebsiella variicola]|uniref:Uncharacterized protein n=1 Tax=Klebsiella variicola TaxID=244366 RepID=A0A9P3PA42_KLEVA|nr:Uncharacterised protein [Klebsiella pneumoniae]BCU60546.1 hypothetical protein KLVA_27050 [Klebsiella variicola]GKJ52034.1 hypothetical protein NUKP32_28690 [Klebsiella variicola]GKJ99387.1 hypothetical protein NUKP37_39640 [Klebsiella variicola]GKK47026.1 hypothetical protein NUKP40_08280 [Klebsiella variicola]